MRNIGEYLSRLGSPERKRIITPNTLDRRIEDWQAQPCTYCGKPLPIDPPRICDCEGAREERATKDTALRQVKETLATEEIERRKDQAGLVGRLRRMTFETFDETLQPEAYEKAQRFTGENGENLIVYGRRYGTGKTHLATAILNRHIDQGGMGRFCEAPTLLRRLRATFSPDARESEHRVFQEIQGAQMLLLDDLGKEKWSEWVEQTIYDIINYRYTRELPTVISTNLLPEELGKAIGLASLSRLSERGTFVELKGDDYRLRNRRKGNG